MPINSSKEKHFAEPLFDRKPRSQSFALARGKRIALVQRALLRWYKEVGRDLPWRHTRDAYKVLVSEIMLQQTQVDRVIPKYNAFLRLFPTVRHLARVPRSRVIHAWAGLGYNRRAVYLHEAAKKVVVEFGGTVPTTIDALRSLPGVGEYTAGAVACFAGGSTAAFLDTNIKRVLGRLFFNAKTKRLPKEHNLFTLAESLVPLKDGDAYFWHHALMDLGATLCRARLPQCEECPLRRTCPFPPFRTTIQRAHYAKQQQSFKNSDRFWRGRIITFVRTSSSRVHIRILQKALNIPSGRLTILVKGLARDGLLIQEKSILALPH